MFDDLYKKLCENNGKELRVTEELAKQLLLQNNDFICDEIKHGLVISHVGLGIYSVKIDPNTMNKVVILK